jgi:host factor-I protein
MKDMDAAAVGRAPAPEPEYGNRKLIRPSLNRDFGRSEQAQAIERRERSTDRLAGAGRKSTPPEQTHAENFYYQKQMQAHTPMTFVLKNGDTLQGSIEWYDKNCLKISRGSRGSVLIYKQGIRYLYKSGD